MLKNNLIKFFRLVYFEVLLILFGSFFYIRYIPHDLPIIRSDGKGYYDYLPALFIYNDLSFSFRGKEIEKYSADTSLNIPVNGRHVNKFTCGTAILSSPFFLIGHSWALASEKYQPNGYSKPYQQSVYIGALFYCCVGLVFMKLILLFYYKNMLWVRFTQILLLFSTHLYIFTFFESSFSHVFSFSLISIFLFLALKIEQQKVFTQRKYLILFSVVTGLILLVRPFNVLIILFLPFIFNGIHPVFKLILELFRKRKTDLLLSVFSFCIVVMIQPIIWYLQAGTLFPWTHSEEGFNFLHPAMWQTLFSFKKGLFIYTPALILSLFYVWVLISKKNYTTLIYFFGAFIILHYFISSWSCWWYAMSFGLRPYVDYLSLFGIAIFVTLIHARFWLKLLASGFVLFCALVNIIQTYQYTTYILHWESMTYDRYKKVFLHIEDQYKGFLWFDRNFNSPDKNNLLRAEDINKPETEIRKGEWLCIYTHETDLSTLHDARGINFVFDVTATINDPSIIFMKITDVQNQKGLLYQERFLFHLLEEYGTKKQVNYYGLLSEPFNNKIKIEFGFKKADNTVLFKPVRIEIYR